MALGSYTQVKFGTLADRLAVRLGDASYGGLGFWTPPEIRSYLREALRAWQAFSAFYSTRVSFGTTSGARFYVLQDIVSELSYTITDRDLIQQIAWSLQEPYTDGSTWGGRQFDYDAVVSAIQTRRDRFIVESGLGLRNVELPYGGDTSGVFQMPDDVVDIRHVMWKDANGRYSVLWKTDQFSLSAGSPAWFQSPGTPTDYSTVLQQPLALQLSPPPNDIGWVNFIYVASGGELDPKTAPTILNIPDDLSWVVKFGALADLFSSDGVGEDDERAKYCEGRWTEGIQLARIYNNVRLGYLNGVPCLMDGIEELDAAVPNWANSSGAPESLVATGSVVATNPVADARPYSISFDITPNFPVPVSDLDWVQLGQEYLDVIVDYAEHLANVKVGAEELKSTYGLYQNFASLAATLNDRLQASAKNFDVLSDRSRLSERLNPRRNTDLR